LGLDDRARGVRLFGRRALGVGVLGVVRMVPAGLAAPFLAMPGDRYPRERVLTVVTLSRAALMGAAAAAVWLEWAIGVVYVLVALASVVSSATHSTQYALLPLLARSPHELVAANVGLATIEGLGTLVGPVIGAGLLAFTGRTRCSPSPPQPSPAQGG
jgi:MFS family permease